MIEYEPYQVRGVMYFVCSFSCKNQDQEHFCVIFAGLSRFHSCATYKTQGPCLGKVKLSDELPVKLCL